MRSLPGLVSFSFGGVLVVVALALAIGDLSLDAYVGVGFTLGVILGFLGFFLLGIGFSLLLESKNTP